MLELTDAAYWDHYWRSMSLPAEVKHGQGLYLDAILDCLDRHLPRGSRLRALEIGGAPGRYLAYLHRHFGYEVTCLDYSPEGCRMARENFQLLGIDAHVVQGDLFASDLHVEQHDVVLSLGLIEHFSSLESVIRAHLRFLRPGGTLLLGAPNLRGVNAVLLKRLAPEILDTCDSDAMDLRRWSTFEHELGLEPIFRGYLGGFEPSVFRARRRSRRRTFLGALAEGATLVLHDHGRWMRRLNGAAVSGYLMGIYRAPETRAR